jgi:hypothetical protein
LDLGTSMRLERVVWSRDRSEKPLFQDRTATAYEVSVSTDKANWQMVAGDLDRVPRDYPHRPATFLTLAHLADNEAAEISVLQTKREKLQTDIARIQTSPKVYAGRFVSPPDTHRFHRGDPMAPREVIAPGPLTNFKDGWKLPLEPVDSVEPLSGEAARRMALARWIVDPGNPLTARVMVNRLWHYHFGTGIVDTPSDFGRNGGKPTHPELLDWLARDFIDNDWRLKRIHRLILMSATYRQSSAAREEGVRVDAGNRLLWRFQPRRMEAEALRDAILATSGKLDLRMGGPGFDLFEPNTNYVKVYTTKTAFQADDFRRMIYQNKPRAELDTLFGAFDCPDAGQPQPRRTVSTTPLQALNLLNSEFILQQATFLAERLQKEAGDSRENRVNFAFRLVFGRDPVDAERSSAMALAQSHGWDALCRALYNSNEFVFIR